MALPSEQERYSLADALARDEQDRIELIDGDRPEDVDTLVEPDISAVCDPSKLDEIGCKGAPDLVIEILSPSTARCEYRS